MLSAIVIIGPETRREVESGALSESTTPEFSIAATQLQQSTPLACVEVLGRSVVGRVIDEVRRADVDAISVFVNVRIAPRHPANTALARSGCVSVRVEVTLGK